MNRERMLSRYLELRDTGEEYSRGAVSLCGEIVRSYMPLIRWTARRQLAKTPVSAKGVIGYEDLEAAGMAGLFDALQSHDPYRGGSFTGYAAAMIRWAMIHQVRAHRLINPWFCRTLGDSRKPDPEFAAVAHVRGRQAVAMRCYRALISTSSGRLGPFRTSFTTKATEPNPSTHDCHRTGGKSRLTSLTSIPAIH
jgi:hypothetical protein